MDFCEMAAIVRRADTVESVRVPTPSERYAAYQQRRAERVNEKPEQLLQQQAVGVRIQTDVFAYFASRRGSMERRRHG